MVAKDRPLNERAAAAVSYIGPVSIIVYLYAVPGFVRRHGRQALTVFVLQVAGCVVVDLFRPVIGAWVYVGWAVFLAVTIGLQVWLAADAFAGREGELAYMTK